MTPSNGAFPSHTDTPPWKISTGGQNGSVLEIAYGTNGNSPQVMALHTHSGYARLICGAGTTWGTSVVILPVVWEHGHDGPTQGAYLYVNDIDVGRHAVIVRFTSAIAGISVGGTLRLLPPTEVSIQADVSVMVAGTVALDPQRQEEAFKLVMLSSMHLGEHTFDTDAAFVGIDSFCLPAPDRWIVQPRRRCHTFGLRGGVSAWQQGMPAPTVTIQFLEPVFVSCWKSTPHYGADSDNVGLWAATPEIQRAWEYRITASIPGANARPTISFSLAGPCKTAMCHQTCFHRAYHKQTLQFEGRSLTMCLKIVQPPEQPRDSSQVSAQATSFAGGNSMRRIATSVRAALPSSERTGGRTRRQTVLRAFQFGLVFLVSILILPGCHKSRSASSAPVSSIHFYGGIDTSGGFRPCLDTAITQASKIAAKLSPGTDSVALYRVDCECHEIYS